MDSNFQFLVASPSEGGRDSSLENESGSVAEPKVRIHLSPAQSLVRTFPSGSDRRNPPINGVKVGLAVYQDVERIRRRLDRTEDLVRPRRALARLLQLEEQPAAPCKIRTTYMFSRASRWRLR